MQYEERFGKELLVQERPGKINIWVLLGILMFSALGIFALIGFFVVLRTPEYGVVEMAGALIVGVGGFAAAAFLYRLLLGYRKQKKAALYERGFVRTVGTETTEIDFRALKGMQDLTTLQSAGNIRVTVRLLTMLRKDNTKVVLGQFDVPAYTELFNALSDVYTDYLLEGISSENLDRAAIFFGDKLELSGGQLIHRHGEGSGWTGIALDRVYGLDPARPDGNSSLRIMGVDYSDGKREILAQIPFKDLFNIDALYRIVQIRPQ